MLSAADTRVLRMKRLAPFLLVAIFLIAEPVNGQSNSIVEKIQIPAKEKIVGGRTEDISLDTTLFRPSGQGPFPTVIFNHGYTGGGRRSPAFTALSDALVARGIAVLVPARRGINNSGGSANEPASCDVGENQAAVLHAMDDLDAVVAFAKSQLYLDLNRLLIGGQSRGGILSVVYAARRRDLSVKGIINFVGIWNDDRCVAINDALYTEAAGVLKVPNLWLYAENDRMTSNSSAKRYADIFRNGGGNLTFKLYSHDFGNGHSLVYSGVRYWSEDLGRFLDSLGI